MQVILKTVPRLATIRSPKSGKTFKGALHFEVQVYVAGEEGSVWKGSRPPSTAAEWLRQESTQGTVVVPPPSVLLDAPPVEVPAAALRALPSDALVAMEWTLAPERKT
jgi:hypothetical protein